jgi:glutathione S-transferase
MPDDYREAVKKGLAAKQFPFLEKALAGRDYLMGDFTVADGYLFTVLNWTKFHNIDLSAFPSITAFMKRVAARPAVQEAMKAEGLLKAAA